jgi:hypothetical protein
MRVDSVSDARPYRVQVKLPTTGLGDNIGMRIYRWHVNRQSGSEAECLVAYLQQRVFGRPCDSERRSLEGLAH